MKFVTQLRPHRVATSAGLIALAASIFLTGCLSGPRATTAETRTPFTKNRLADDGAARKEIETARRMIEEGDTSTVIPRLYLTMGKYPDSDIATEGLFLLGRAYNEIGSYRNAQQMFEDYLRVAPDGPRANDSRQFLANISDHIDQHYLTPEKLDAQLAEILGTLETAPESLDNRLELADVLWKRGDYERAGRVYESIVERRPDVINDPVVSRRVDMESNGSLILMTPAEIERREVENRPLGIINVNSFRSGRDLLTRESRYYVVTGQAINRSDSVLYGVNVHVTIYGFGNVVYDASTVNIGRLDPGERRSFSVRFSNFANIENIHRHEAIGSFQR